MPLYRFECVKEARKKDEKCGKEFEQVLNFGDIATVRCPKCGSKEVRQVFKAANVVFRWKDKGGMRDRLT